MLYVALMDALTPASTLTEVNFEKLSATFKVEIILLGDKNATSLCSKNISTLTLWLINSDSKSKDNFAFYIVRNDEDKFILKSSDLYIEQTLTEEFVISPNSDDCPY